MTRFAERVQVLAAVFAVGVGAVLALAGGSTPHAPLAQKDGPKVAEFPKPPVAPELVGAVICKGCHNEEKPEQNPLYMETRGFEFVRLSENRVWGVHDLHSKAFENLKTATNPVAKRMEENLKAFRGADYAVTKDVNCLACHASHRKPLAIEPAAKWTPASFYLPDGVGCEMCHGHGKAYRDKHQESDLAAGEPKEGEPTRVVPWREWSPAAKEEWGLVNLRDPLVATARCASCHVGNAAEGRFVTHEMYAAGHPPLPPLDLMAYAREQPRHWGLPTEMKFLTDLAKKHPEKALAVFHFHGDEAYATRRFAESTVAALRATADCTEQLAASAKKNDEWGLDFAAFDCASCHHDLKYPSDRQARGYTGRPGRPLFRPAPFALARVVVGHAATLDGGKELAPALAELDKAEKALADSCNRRAFGDPDLVIPASKAIANWCDATLKKLGDVKYDRKATETLLAAVTDAATRKPVADPEVAQLYFWAVETLVLELAGPPTQDAKPPAVLTQLNDKLKGTVVTRLRPNAPFYFEQRVDGAAPNQEPVADRLKRRTEVFYSFKADAFAEAFGEIPR